MNVYISYFYKLRFFPEHAIPLSTAKSDPKWFHDFKGEKHLFLDKRGVYNGLRVPELAPASNSPECVGCSELDRASNSGNCAFLRAYRNQIGRLNFGELWSQFEMICNFVKRNRELEVDPYVVLMVYETPDNPCSERAPIIDWFAENGVTVKEWSESAV